MKKLLWFSAGIVTALSMTAIAASITFTDAFQFSDWYKDAVQKMADAGVIKGYADGSFQPDKPVSRAELAVMLDRYESKVVDERIGHFIRVFPNQNLTRQFFSAHDAYILAKAGLFKLSQAPNLVGPPRYDKVTDLKTEVLPDGWEDYSKGLVGTPDFYLHQLQPQFNVDVWYGPFLGF